MRKQEFNRRTLLKGLGSVAVGLPLLEEMMVRPVAAAAVIPTRAFNVFFGLGIPTAMQYEGFDMVLAPLKPLQDKLLFMREVDQIRCDESGINAHFDGASGAFTAEPPNGEAKSGGPSIDQVIRRAAHPDGMPADMVPTLVSGTFFRRSRLSRYVHSYNHDGTVAAKMTETPRAMFDRVFGSVGLSGSANARDERINRSVLDSVVEQYRYYTGANSPLGATSKRRIADHLDRVREYEQRAYAHQKKSEHGPAFPPRSALLHGGDADPGGMGIDITLDELRTEWRLMADLYALAIKMDRVRFGSLTFLAAGERIRLTGNYQYEGKDIYTFDDSRQLNATGDQGCSHEWWHKYSPKKDNEALRAHAHMKMEEVAYFLNLLDDGESMESNEKTILENMLLTISTESGDGRHSDVKRELSGVFHAITSANGRFKTGGFMDIGAEGLDVYNSMLHGLDIQERMGPAKREHHLTDKIFA